MLTCKRRPRRGWISKKVLHELYCKKDGDCWPWIGSVHTATGQPLFKGWQYPRRTVFERHKRSLLSNEVFAGQTCGNRLCVNPDHQVVKKVRRRKVQEGLWI